MFRRMFIDERRGVRPPPPLTPRARVLEFDSSLVLKFRTRVVVRCLEPPLPTVVIRSIFFSTSHERQTNRIESIACVFVTYLKTRRRRRTGKKQ